MDNEFLSIGEIVKPQGIMGEVKIKPFSENIQKFTKIKEVYIDNLPYKVLNARIAMKDVFLSISGIADRNKAETFRGKIVKAKREDLPKLKKGEFYVVDVIDSLVITENGKKIGKVKDIIVGSKDVYTVESENKKIIMFPLLKDLLISMDVINKEIIVEEKRFLEVAVYED